MTENSKPSFKFQVGRAYKKIDGELVWIVSRTTDVGYECVLGSDGVYRYDRSTDSTDAGRVTGTDTKNPDPRNIGLQTQKTQPAIYGPRIEPRKTAPRDTRILGWCADEKVWKIGKFLTESGRLFFLHEGKGFVYGEHEVSHWTELPAAT